MIPTRDLPEPSPHSEGGEEGARAFDLWLTALLFVTLYSSLHRLWVPAFLKFTPLQGSPYAQIDLSFVLGLLLWRRAAQKRFCDLGCALLAGALVGWSLFEFWNVAAGNFPGWLGLSHAISSLPLGAVAFFAFRWARGLQSFVYAWVSALAAIAIWASASRFMPFSELSRADRGVSAPSVKESQVVAGDNASCGALQLRLDPTLRLRSLSGAMVEVQDCGLAPSTLRLQGDSISFSNPRDRSLNLHLMIFSPGRAPRQVGNWVLAPRRRLQRKVPLLGPNEVLLLYSDNEPKVGLSVLWQGTHESEIWSAQRFPLGFSRHSEALQ
jgi:hypothetical protein